MKKIFTLLFFLLCACCRQSAAAVVPISFDVIDVYSAVSAYEGTPSSPNSYFEVTHGLTSASLTRSFDFGFFSGTQSGMIVADPSSGMVTVKGSSETIIASGASGGGYRSDGRHIVLGSFFTPNIGAPLTTVSLAFNYIENIGSALLFGLFKEANWDASLFQPDVHLSSGIGGAAGHTLTFDYMPGEKIYFVFGVQPGVGVFGSGFTPFYNTDSIEGSYQLFYEKPVSIVPEPSTLILVTLGLLAMVRITKYNYLKP